MLKSTLFVACYSAFFFFVRGFGFSGAGPAGAGASCASMSAFSVAKLENIFPHLRHFMPSAVPSK
jgi:hypothetical protein